MPFGILHTPYHLEVIFMATVFSTERMNIVEAFKREKYAGYESLLGALIEQNDFLRVATVLPANKGSFHETLVADSLGTGAVRAANEGVTRMSSQTHIKTDPIVSYEGDSEVDELVIASAPDPVAARMTEDSMNLAGFSNGWNGVLLNGNKNTAKGFEGLATRRGKASNEFTWDMSGSSNLSSAYLVEFGPNAVSLRYTPGSTPGIKSEDMGLQKCYTGSNNAYFWGWVQHYAINFGLSVRQERALQRFANIDVTSDSVTSLLSTAIKAKNKLPSKGRGAYLFCNSDVLSMFEIGILNKASNLRTVEIEGYGPVTMFVNVPILPMDAIATGETQVQ